MNICGCCGVSGGAHGCVDCRVGMHGCALSRPISHQTTNGCEWCVLLCILLKLPLSTELCSWSNMYPFCTLPITNTAFLHAAHTSPSCFFHSCPSFFTTSSYSSSWFVWPYSVCVYGRDEMHHLFVPIINTLCACHFGPIQCGHHLCFGVLAVMPVVHHQIALNMCTFALQIQHKRAEVVTKTPPIQLASWKLEVLCPLKTEMNLSCRKNSEHIGCQHNCRSIVALGHSVTCHDTLPMSDRLKVINCINTV